MILPWDPAMHTRPEANVRNPIVTKAQILKSRHVGQRYLRKLVVTEVQNSKSRQLVQQSGEPGRFGAHYSLHLNCARTVTADTPLGDVPCVLQPSARPCLSDKMLQFSSSTLQCDRPWDSSSAASGPVNL